MFICLAIKKSSHPRSGKLKLMFHLGLILPTLLLITILSGCANHNARTQELLAEDFHSLSNDNLLLYYYKLEDQIEIVEQKRRGSMSFGLGMGGFGHSSGGGGSVGVTTGGSSQQNIATNLRDRRNKVRLELRHRDITP